MKKRRRSKAFGVYKHGTLGALFSGSMTECLRFMAFVMRNESDTNSLTLSRQ